MNNDILLNALSLLEAIYKNDLEKAKILVDYLNNNFEPQDGLYFLNDIIPLNSIVNNVNNDTVLYVLNNLKHMPEAIEQLKWNINSIYLLKENDPEIIKEFILNIINNNKIQNYQIPVLIQLCVTIDNYDLLKNIRSIFKNNIEQEA